MDTDQWPEGIGVVKPMEAQGPMIDPRKPRPQKPQALNCPRCNSTHTKFCYYNNYSLTQPRYFCKSCRRYWTEGGSLRNVPVGGGSRKNKRSAPSKKLPDHHLAPPSFSQPAAYQNPKTIHEGQDLNLGYPPTSGSTYGNNISEFVEVPYNGNYKTYNHYPNTALSTSSHQHHVSAMELLKTGIVSNTIYSSGLGFQDFKQNINFSQDRFESGYGNLQGVQGSTSARLFFPFEELKPVSTTTEFGSNKGHGESTGYWNGGSW